MTVGREQVELLVGELRKQGGVVVVQKGGSRSESRGSRISPDGAGHTAPVVLSEHDARLTARRECSSVPSPAGARRVGLRRASCQRSMTSCGSRTFSCTVPGRAAGAGTAFAPPSRDAAIVC